MRQGRRHDPPDGVADGRYCQLQPVDPLRVANQDVTSPGHVVTPKRLDMAEMKMGRGLRKALAVSGNETDDVDALLQNAQRSIGNLREINGVLDDHTAILRFQHRGVVGVDAKIARNGRLSIQIHGPEMKMLVLPGCDR